MAMAMFIIGSLEQVQQPCDATGFCLGLTSVSDFSVTFNATSNKGLWNLGGHMNASYIFFLGRYTAYVNGSSENALFNYNLGN
jgi:hypothetical protein